MLKVLAAIQFRSRGDRVAKFALLCHLARNRVYATRKLFIPKDCILSITIFHVAMVLTQRRRGRRRWNVNLLSAMFLQGLWKIGIWNPESGIRNSQPFQRHLLEIVHLAKKAYVLLVLPYPYNIKLATNFNMF